MKSDLEINEPFLRERDICITTSPICHITQAECQTIKRDGETTDTGRQAIEAHGLSSSTSVFEVIKWRRSIGQVTNAQPTPAQIERLLEAATYAPSHHVTEPWHFFVLTGAARDKLGEVMEESLRQRLHGPVTEQTQEQLLRERTKPRRSPVIITVAIQGVQQLAGEPIEHIEAAAAAVQNMLLVATEMGLATIWRTGDPARDPLVKQWFGLDPADHIVAFVYVGYPKVARAMRVPTHFSKKTTWLS